MNEENRNQKCADGSLTVATWNIGHFAGGRKYCSTITRDAYPEQLAAYREYIGSMGADILSLNEYSDEMIRNERSTATKKVLLSDYPVAMEGDRRYYSCNALFSKVAIEKIAVREYDCNQGKWKNVQINPKNAAVSATQYYYLEADLTVNGMPVKVICTHLAFQGIEKDPLIRDQVEELIAKFGSCERVILMGDWNSEDFPFFKDCFARGGFLLANEHADVVTYPSDEEPLSLDNFAYKGVAVQNFRVVPTTLSDHYAVVCRMTVN